MLETIAHGPVVELRMNRPPANAMSAGMIAALKGGVVDAIEGDARALVLSGQPGMFSAGLDVPSLLQLDREGIRAAWADFIGLLEIITNSPIPIVVAITGHSPAGGAVVALYCDYRVMAEGPFKIGLNEVEVGIILPPLLFGALRRQVGAHHAERMGVAGMLISADEAYRVNLVDELAAPGEVVAQALARCEQLLRLPPVAMAESRRNARRDLVELVSEFGESSLDDLVENWFSDETQVALNALVTRLAAR
jgi:3,2-trans-enoyl-CoA isomerase